MSTENESAKLSSLMKKFAIISTTTAMERLMRGKEMHAINAVLSQMKYVMATTTIVTAIRMKI